MTRPQTSRQLISGHRAAQAAPDLSVPVLLRAPRLQQWREESKDIEVAYFRAIAAIAAKDGYVSLPECAAALSIAAAVAESSGSGPLAANLTIHFLDSRPALDAALKELSRTCKGLPHDQRTGLLRLAAPVIQMQGDDSRPTALRLAKALHLSSSDADREFTLAPTATGGGGFGAMIRSTARAVGLVDDYRWLSPIARTYGETELFRLIESCDAAPAGLADGIRRVLSKIEEDLARFRAEIASDERAVATADALTSAAGSLERIVQERLAIVAQRVAHQKTALQEDLIDLVSDVGAEMTATLHERFHTDDWRKKAAWENFAETQAAKSIELRLARLKARYESQIGLLREELTLFQRDIRISANELVARRPASDFAALVPHLSLGARFMNATDKLMNVTLAASALSAFGATGLVVANLVALPVVAPLAATLGGTLAIGGLYKILTSAKDRKFNTIREVRKGIEERCADMLKELPSQHAMQLDAIVASYQVAAENLLAPVLLNAQAAEEMKRIRRPLSERLIAQTEAKLDRLRSLLEVAPPAP